MPCAKFLPDNRKTPTIVDLISQKKYIFNFSLNNFHFAGIDSTNDVFFGFCLYFETFSVGSYSSSVVFTIFGKNSTSR